MRLSTGLLSSIMLLTISFASHVSAGEIWNESSQGDFSGDFASPTDLGTLALGSNTLSGESTAGPTEDLTIPAAPDYPEIDVDLWKLNIAPGEYLNQIVLTSYSNENRFGHTGGSGGIPGGGSFFGVQVGNQITASVTGPPSDLMGGGLIGVLPGAQVGNNVLDDLGSGIFSAAPFNLPTFSGPLGTGTYTFWYQEGPMDTEYTLDFQVSTVPEPTSMIGLGTLALATMLLFRFHPKKSRLAH